MNHRDKLNAEIKAIHKELKKLGYRGWKTPEGLELMKQEESLKIAFREQHGTKELSETLI